MPMGTMCEELGDLLSFGGWHEVAEREVRKLGVALEPSHWPRGKRGNWAPLEATGGSGPERQCGDLAKPGAFSA